MSNPPAGPIVIVGHSTIDEIWLPGAEAAVEIHGGAALYAVTGALMVGAHVELVTAIGDDYQMGPIEEVASKSPGTLEIHADRSVGGSSIRNVCRYSSAEEREWFIADWDTLVRMSPRWDRAQPAITRSAAVIVCPTPVDIAADIVRRAIDVSPYVLVDTEKHYIDSPDRAAAFLGAGARGAVLVPSWAHLGLLFGDTFSADDSSSRRLLEVAVEWGLSALVVKQGRDGCLVVDGAAMTVTHIPAFTSAQVVDPTGAGDAFDGAFAAVLTRRGDVVEAASWGAMAGSFAVEVRGPDLPPHFSAETARDRLTQIQSGIERRRLLSETARATPAPLSSKGET